MARSLYSENGKTLDTKVSYIVFDAQGKKIFSVHRYDCFAKITYNALPYSATTLIVHRSLAQIPYNYKTIQKWVEVLNELGFPVSVRQSFFGNIIKFTFNLADYKYKVHLNSALQLVRCLFERYICYVPSYFFKFMKIRPDADKFLILQYAHRQIHNKLISKMANTNHMCTYNSFTLNVTRQEFFDNAKMFSTIFQASNFSLSCQWQRRPNQIKKGIFLI